MPRRGAFGECECVTAGCPSIAPLWGANALGAAAKACLPSRRRSEGGPGAHKTPPLTRRKRACPLANPTARPATRPSTISPQPHLPSRASCPGRSPAGRCSCSRRTRPARSPAIAERAAAAPADAARYAHLALAGCGRPAICCSARPWAPRALGRRQGRRSRGADDHCRRAEGAQPPQARRGGRAGGRGAAPRCACCRPRPAGGRGRRGTQLMRRCWPGRAAARSPPDRPSRARPGPLPRRRGSPRPTRPLASPRTPAAGRVQGMEGWAARELPRYLKDSDTCWQPSDWLPEPASPDFQDQVCQPPLPLLAAAGRRPARRRPAHPTALPAGARARAPACTRPPAPARLTRAPPRAAGAGAAPGL